MNANIDRVDTESLPPRGTSRTRYASAICVHPFLFAFICVFPSLPAQGRERLPAAIVTPRGNAPDRVRSIRMVIAPPAVASSLLSGCGRFGALCTNADE